MLVLASVPMITLQSKYKYKKSVRRSIDAMTLHVYKIKSFAGRATAFVSAVVFAGTVVSMALPGLASADAYNPLTDRSLMLSSSSPGWANTDGSGNANTSFAAPGSGADGKRTEETFSFKVSTDSSGAGPD